MTRALVAVSLVIPAVAAGQGLAAGAATAPPADVQVVTWTQWGPDLALGQYHIVGEVIDNDTRRVQNVRVAVTDAAGHIVETVDAENAILAEGETTPFDIALSKQCIGCALAVTAAPTLAPTNHKFTITPDPLTVATEPDGTKHLIGTVQNDNTVPASYIKLTVTFYDSLHRVVDEDSRYLLNSSSSMLAASPDSAAFDLVHAPGPHWTTEAVTAESSSPPSLPIVSPSSAQVEFGNVLVPIGPAVVVPSTRTLTITNTGNDMLHIANFTLAGSGASDFTIVPGGCPLAVTPSGTCTVDLQFLASARGDRSATLSIEDEAADSPQSVALHGVGLAPTANVTSPVNLGDQVVTTSGSSNLIITNGGNASLQVDTGLTGVPSGTAFSADPSGCAAALAPSGQCSITVTFAPTSTGPDSTTLSVYFNGLNSPTAVTLNATGTNPVLAVSPSGLNFGTTRLVGTVSATQTITVTNGAGGIGNLHVLSVNIPGAHAGDYQLTNQCTEPVAPSGSCTVGVKFAPTAGGNRAATLSITSDALVNGSRSVTLSGTAIGPVASLSPNLDFGNQQFSSPSAPKAVTLRNTGVSPLAITSIAATGEYTLVESCPRPLPAGTSCVISVTFTPTTVGVRQGVLTVTDNDPSGSQSVNLTGRGVSDWVPLGGILTSGPDVSSWAPGRLDVFARGSNNSLIHTWFTGGTWRTWESLGGQLASDPTAVSWSANRLDVFARGTNGSLIHKWYDGAIWHDWESLGGSLTSGPDALSWAVGRLDIFARGRGSVLIHKWYDAAGWHNWESLGGTLTSDPSAASWAPRRLDIFARGADLSLVHKYYDGSAWHDWESLGGRWTSSPDAATWGPGRLDVVMRGSEGAVWHKWYDGVTWAGHLESLGLSATSDPAAIAKSINRVDAFARGPDGGLWWRVILSG
jgi:repeat uncharacterized protein DUF346/ASPM-SPD-2-Hydin domain-containing protein/uncharacterized protein DUF1573